MEVKKWINRAMAWVGVFIITPVAVSLLTDFFREKPVFETAANAIRWFICYDIKLWKVAVVFVLILIAVSVIAERKKEKEREKERENNALLKKPAFYNYTYDDIDGIGWEWGWVQGQDGRWGVYNLMPVCPRHKSPLIDGRFDKSGKYVCSRSPQCGYSIEWDMIDEGKARMRIWDNARKMSRAPQMVNPDF
ncbi:hypothetical protein Barb6XT_03111 [Bacteroidales bacterium Barb6XT]|nr:hypothetical protein Barb6XT_03111 [Bacteroidales bacterium Barb6XT]